MMIALWRLGDMTSDVDTLCMECITPPPYWHKMQRLNCDGMMVLRNHMQIEDKRTVKRARTAKGI
jgi:hypothetical protein